MKRLLIIAATGLLFNCGQKKEETASPPISYETTTFRLESEGGCKSDTAVCATYEMSYPVFNGLDSIVADSITTRINALVSVGNPEVKGQSLELIGKAFINDFTEFNKETPELGMGWFYEGAVNVETLTDSLLSLSLKEDYFTGGAHGGHSTFFININPNTGEAFTLQNYLMPDQEESVRRIGERIFRREHELADTASLIENMFEFPNDRFELNKNYGFTKDGILFYYNSYEIAAYAMGPSEVLIPYDSLKR